MKSHEMTVEAKGTSAIKMWKSFVENKPRGESINEIGKTEGGGALDGIPPHRFEQPLKRVGCALIG